MAVAQEIGRLIVRLVGDGKQYQAMLVKSASATKAFAAQASASLKAVGTAMSSLGRTMALRVTAPLLILGALATHAFAKFDQAMIESTSIMEVTTQQMEEMRQTALSLSISGQGAQGPTELAQSYFFLASAGKDAAQSIALLPKVMDFATAGAFDMALATDLLTDAQSALGLTSKNVAIDTENLVRVSDVLVKANTLANASVQQFSTALTSKAAAAMKSFSIPMEEGVAVLAAFADQGIKAELAGNSFSRMMLLMSKAAQDNKAAFKEHNFMMFDSMGNVRKMGDIIANLEEALRGMSAEQKTVTLSQLGFNARVQGAILPLIGTSDAIKRYTKELKNAGGITGEVAEKQMKSFSNRMKVFKNRITAVGIEIGKTLAPMLAQVTGLIERGTEAWKNLSPTMKRMAIILAVVSAAAGPVLIILGALVSAIGTLLTPVGLIIAGVAALAAGIVFLQVRFGLFSPIISIVKSLWKSFSLLYEITKPLLVLTAGPLFVSFKILGAVLENVVVPALTFVANRLEELADGLEKIKTVADSAKEAFVEFFSVTSPEIEEAIEKTNDAIQKREELIRKQEELFKRTREQNAVADGFLVGLGVTGRSEEGFGGILDELLNVGGKPQGLIPPPEKEALGPSIQTSEQLLASATQKANEFNVQLAESAELAALGAAELEGFGIGVHSALKAQHEADKTAGDIIQKLKQQANLTRETALELQIQSLEQQGVNQHLIESIRLEQKNLEIAKETAKTKKLEERAMETIRKEAERLTTRFRTPAKEFGDIIKDLESKLSMGLIDKGTFDRAFDFAAERFRDLQEQATIQLKILAPRGASQLGTLEAEQRLAEFRNAIAQPGKSIIPGPQLPPGPRFQPPQFRAAGNREDDLFAPENPQLQRAETNKTLDMIAGFLERVAEGTDALVDKNPGDLQVVEL